MKMARKMKETKKEMKFYEETTFSEKSFEYNHTAIEERNQSIRIEENQKEKWKKIIEMAMRRKCQHRLLHEKKQKIILPIIEKEEEKWNENNQYDENRRNERNEEK